MFKMIVKLMLTIAAVNFILIDINHSFFIESSHLNVARQLTSVTDNSKINLDDDKQEIQNMTRQARIIKDKMSSNNEDDDDKHLFLRNLIDKQQTATIKTGTTKSSMEGANFKPKETTTIAPMQSYDQIPAPFYMNPSEQSDNLTRLKS